MKQFSGQYSQFSIGKLPQPTAMGPSSTLNKTSSNRNPIKPISNVGKKKQSKQTPLNIRNIGLKQSTLKTSEFRSRFSRSIEEVHHTELDTSIDSLFDSRRTDGKKQSVLLPGKEIFIQNCQEAQLEDRCDDVFGEPYRRLSQIYKSYDVQGRSGIQEELSQVLALIKQQRSIIRKRLQQMDNKPPKKCSTTTTDSSQNTSDIITTKPQLETKQSSTQTSLTTTTTTIQRNQTYKKMIKILEDMKINSSIILPISQQERKNNVVHHDDVDDDKKYKELKDVEIIAVQKFVIKKLVQKIVVLEGERS